jgi:spoIIIJ-associated protein
MRSITLHATSLSEALEQASQHFHVPAGDIECHEGAADDDFGEETAPEAQEALAGEDAAQTAPAAPAAEGTISFRACVREQFWVDQAQAWVQELVRYFGTPVELCVQMIGTQVFVRLSCPEPSILIGKQGHTLDALQHVVTRALTTRWPDYPEVILDVEAYKEKKYQRLERMARQAATRALRTGQPQHLETMTASERKYIHNALKDIPSVRTASHGREPGRHIVVEPLAGASSPGGAAAERRQEGNDRRRGSGSHEEGHRGHGEERLRRDMGERRREDGDENRPTGKVPLRSSLYRPAIRIEPSESRPNSASADERLDWNPTFFKAPDPPGNATPQNPNGDVDDDLHA